MNPSAQFRQTKWGREAGDIYREGKKIHSVFQKKKMGKTSALLQVCLCLCGIPLPLPPPKNLQRQTDTPQYTTLCALRGLSHRYANSEREKKCLASAQTRIVNSYFPAASNRLHSKEQFAFCSLTGPLIVFEVNQRRNLQL